MYGNMKPQRGKTPTTGKKSAPRRPAPKPPAKATDPVEVYCRIRPLDDPDHPVCCKVISPDTIHLTATENSHAAKTGGVIKETKYTFQHVFDEFAPQKSVFDQVAMPLVDDVVHGKNALLFAYGVTSSGKTHTMTGTPQDPGMLPRCLDMIFNSIKKLQSKKYVFKPDKMNGFDVQTEADAMLERQRRELLPKLNNMNAPKAPIAKENDFDINKRQKDRSRVEDLDEDTVFSVFISYVEIYNKYIYDLLEEVEYDPIMGYKAPASKALREDNNHRMYVSGCIEVEVKSTEDAYEILAKGQKRRRVAHTTLNAESSRSHSVLNVRVVQAPLDPDGVEVLQDKDKICSSQLALVDLAGSERAHRTGNHGDRLREAGNINNCLMTLRTCIEVLRENQQTGGNKIVPYRDDRMTHLFKNFFDGDGKVRMVVCVNPKAEEYDETVNVMKFAEMAREVQVTRSQKVQFDIGLMHGRRRLREHYVEQQGKVQEEVHTPEPLMPPVMYSFPAFPSMELSSPDDSHILPHLARYLQDRMQQRQTLLSDYRVKDAAFRSRLVDMEKEYSAFRDRNSDLAKVLLDKENEVHVLEKKIRNLEKANDSLLRKNNTIERKKTSLEREIGEREWQIQMASTEKQRLQHDSRTKMAWMEKNYNKKIEETKKKLNDEASTQMRIQRQRLAKVRNILDSDTDSMISVAGTPMTRNGTRYGMSRITPAKSEPDLTFSDKPGSGGPVPTPRSTHHRAMTTAGGTGNGSKPVSRSVSRGGAPPPTKPKPNMKYHRRSKSSHEVWLDHNPSGAIDTTSVLSPNIRARRSVTKLDAKDTKGVDKYLLTHMDMDSEGELATKLYKGDVLRTSGGGKSIIFNDVEVLKHKSPGDRKRRSCEDRPENYDGEWSDIDDRCRIAIEGHGHLKRTKMSQV